MLKDWNQLPEIMKNEAVYPYYQSLKKKKGSLFIKRLFDFILALFLLVLLSPIFLLIAILIRTDSKGSIFYRQKRVTQYNKVFRIFKFRTMVSNADKIGTQVTIQNDDRITKIGHFLRKYRLDELPQLLNILTGDMSFVGTRPESVFYVKSYTPEMYATLLLPAGITSLASIQFKDEAELLDKAKDIDKEYIQVILPQKMKYNLESIEHFSLLQELKTMIQTVFAVIK